MLQIIDLGDVAVQKPSEVAKRVIPACLVKPKLELDEIHPADLPVLLQAIIDFSELSNLPFPGKESKTSIGNPS